MQYILFIHKLLIPSPSKEEWTAFINLAVDAGFFQGGSEICASEIIGVKPTIEITNTVVGFMQFESNDKTELLKLLEQHPVVKYGGTIELCEMPKSQ